MKVVLDTNVFVAALISQGTCTELLEHCVIFHSIVVSNFILDELRQNLVTKFNYSAEESNEAIKLLQSQMELVIPVPLQSPVCRDPDDDQILATAIAGGAECIVTGDKDLLVIKQYQDVEIIRPNEFADFETRKNEP